MLCVVLIGKEGIVVMGVSSSILFKYNRNRGHLFVLSWDMVSRGSVVSE